ncbi:MAG: gamma-glutamyltransferase, partial [Chloroflexi bacterium]|nr:gamma-glutamyltransferase [Chloroflexota bacterium]
AHTITVPGACGGWCDLLEAHGRLGRAAVLAPAIRLAEEGFPVAPLTAHFWQRGAERRLRNSPGGRALTIDGRAPRAGEIFRNPGLLRGAGAGPAAGDRRRAGRDGAHRRGRFRLRARAVWPGPDHPPRPERRAVGRQRPARRRLRAGLLN